MILSTLTAISPIDGRYNYKVNKLREIFSEFGLFKFRVKIEIKWLQKLASCKLIKELKKFDDNKNNYLNSIIENFDINDAKRIKEIEYITNHDIKAVEYFLKEKCIHLPEIHEFIHFACTSDDINNLSYSLMLSETRSNILLPIWKKIIEKIMNFAKSYKSVPLLSRTHGQPATPSTIGKEIANFVYRMMRQYNQFKKIDIMGKINGAVGNYNAHKIAYPNIDWLSFSKDFVNNLGIKWNPYTTQIEPHDYIAELFYCIIRFNSILINFNRDIWSYVSLNYFTLSSTNNEVGSSTMPNKINPIDFENSEGNLGIANAILDHLSSNLIISRLQRDLTDSTLLRNLGVGISYSLIAYKSVLNGIKKLKVNNFNLLKDLNNHWEILAEPIQTVMRRCGIKNSFNILKKFTKGKNIKYDDIKYFIEKLPILESEKIILRKLSPLNYIGFAEELTNGLKWPK